MPDIEARIVARGSSAWRCSTVVLCSVSWFVMTYMGTAIGVLIANRFWRI
jgi:hypothetical protein